ncbi:MAG: SdiA-regulated domain-containing protein [Candidatus Saccharicenans sp.]|uniref:SdiA-regulated domain-containing protein n=1 Tax=Candidatus Saccharicenans sp. TaxID=2819258 RepID=UPI00404AF73F
MKRILLLFFLVFLVNCSEGPYTTSIRFPYQWLDTPGFGGNIDQQNIAEPSGLCFHPTRKTLFVVSDEGWLYEITTDGAPVYHQRIPGDLEAVAINPQTGLVYIVIEGDDVILEYDPERREVTRRFPVNREFNGNPHFLQKQENQYDNGLESLSFVPDKNHPEGGTFYAGNQWDPPCIVELLVPLKSSQAPQAEARIIRVLPFKIDDPAAMIYDEKTRLLHIVSDADNILVEITLDGKLVKEYAFLGCDQEGISWDDQGFLYIAQDSGGILKVRDLRKRKN